MSGFMKCGVLVVLLLTWLIAPHQIRHSPRIDDHNLARQVPVRLTADGYIHHDLIFIDGNEDFLAQAAAESWPGTGTEKDPIIITRYSFASSDHLFEVLNTDLYFEFRDNQLDGVDGVWCTIYLGNVTNGAIIDCSLWNGAIALHMSRINSCIMTGNEIFDNTWEAIALEGNSHDNLIERNYIHHNAKGGVSLWGDSHRNRIHNNTIAENADIAIHVPTDDNEIVENTITENQGSGIKLYAGAKSNLVQNNIIHDNDGDGITMNAIESEVIENLIYGNDHGGIEVYFESEQNLIARNTILNNTKHGVIISDMSRLNTIENNDFVDNGEACQAYDEGQDNLIQNNYWFDWIQPDDDQDGIVDHPYSIEGNANNTDAYPRAIPNLEIPDGFAPTPTSPQGTTETTEGNSTLPHPFLIPLGLSIVVGAVVIASVIVILVFKRRN